MSPLSHYSGTYSRVPVDKGTSKNVEGEAKIKGLPKVKRVPKDVFPGGT